MNSSDKLLQWVHRELFQLIPFNIAVIDRYFNIVEANRNFEEYFGEWRGRKCYEVSKGQIVPCEHCDALKTFEDGLVRVVDSEGLDRHGRRAHYVVHISPVFDEERNIPYVIEMATDITETKRWQREYQILFERVPCYITVIDRNFRITRANEKFRETFGEARGRLCYEVYKKRKTRCPECPAAKTFEDGAIHSSQQVGQTLEGEKTHYVVTTSPLARSGGESAHVIEIANDVTELVELQDRLSVSRRFQDNLITNSLDGIIGTDYEGEVVILNPAVRNILKIPAKNTLKLSAMKKMLPVEYEKILKKQEGSCHLMETEVVAADGERIPVRFIGSILRSKGKFLGSAAFIQDLRILKTLEHEKLEAERLAAVGQTVAGLAHSVKNILMGLEGGMYMVSSGLKRSDHLRISEGWEVLERNFEKTTALVKDFLSFAKGRLPRVKLLNPNDLITEVVDLYQDTTLKMGISFVCDLQKRIPQVPLDPDGIHTCLTNLISNAIDACQMSEKSGRHVTLRTRLVNEILTFEVEDDGLGMDYEVKQKVFTTFFTTKGGGGTGLGLLTTRRIVQEHGGSLSLESEKGRGSVFRMEFPMTRLPKLEENQAD